MKLRSYQQELVAGALKEWGAGHRRIAAVMATGGGKTPTAMAVANLSLDAGQPVLWLAHRTELIDQAIDKAQQVAPSRRIGRLQGRVKQYRAEIVVGSNLTACTAATLPLLKTRRWGLIVIDETHHVAADTYQRILRELGAFEPNGPLTLGVTATLDRADGLALGDTFESVVSPRIGLLDLIRHPEGPFLVPPRGIRVRIAELDLAHVRRTAGDFNSGALGAAMSAAMAPVRIVEAWQEHAKGRATIAFLPTVAISIEQAETFRAAGYRAVHIDADTPAAERVRLLDDFRAGDIDILCNVGLFTEGTDLPRASCIILGRPTSSTTLYQQMVGRGLRIHPGKRDCVILDVTGVTGKHRLATLVSLAGASRPEDLDDDLLIYEEDREEMAAALDDLEPSTVDVSTGPEDPEYADGDLEHELIDLFGQSHSAWLRTTGGTWFLPVPQGFIYLAAREHDRYDLCWRVEYPNYAGWRSPGSGEPDGTIQADMEIGYAMAAGDEYVAARPLWMAERDAPWRKLPAGRGRTKGDVADEKARRRATELLDGSY
ncbi:MAG: DEAD/DEAH box helicase [Patulibacter sp.]|nr:DEAD/DEAH box helicase [Patulibacter sp.]